MTPTHIAYYENQAIAKQHIGFGAFNSLQKYKENKMFIDRIRQQEIWSSLCYKTARENLFRAIDAKKEYEGYV